MNEEYLSADCAFEFLFNTGFMDRKEWKLNTEQPYYNVIFFAKTSLASAVSFEISVFDGIHRIPKSNIRVLKKRFSMEDFDAVLKDCAI
jgi:hypothetical protein